VSFVNKHRVHIHTSTSKEAIETTIIATKTANNTLKLSLVICPSISAMFMHVASEMITRRSSERIKVFSVTIFIHVNGDPVLAGLGRGIGVTDEKSRVSG
jgi:hypothetical protein